MLSFAIILIATLLASTSTIAADENLRLGVIGGRAINRDAYLALFNEFQPLVPQSELLLVTEDDKGYKKNIRRWMQDHITDISYAHVGQKLCAMGSEGLLASLNSFWEYNEFDNRFDTNFKRAVECGKNIYGIPIAYYYWGFFYNKKLFKELDLSPPGNWSELKKVIEILNDNDKVPVLLGNRQHWPGVAWLDYINLRLHGLQFHLDFTKGLVPFDSEEVRQTLEFLKQLLDKQAFIKSHRHQAWNASLPLLYRREAGLILSGSYIVNGLPQTVKQDIGFFAFPRIAPDIPRYEDVPVDVFVLNKQSRKNQVSSAFLKFIAKTRIQSFLADKLGYLPPAKGAAIPDDRFANIGFKHINEADGYAQYFDRDAIPRLAETIPEIVADFIENPDIESTILEMEKVRVHALKKQESTVN